MNSDFLNLSPSDIFLSREINLLSAIKLCYGGSGIKAYFLKRKDLEKYLRAKIHDEATALDDLFLTLQSE